TDIVNSVIKIDEKTIATCSDDNTVRVWDIKEKKEVAKYDLKAIEIFYKNNFLIVKHFDSNISIWFLDKDNSLKDTTKKYEVKSNINYISVDEDTLIFSTASGNLYVEKLDFDNIHIINKNYTNHFHIKTLLLGNSAVGKTTLGYGLEYNKFNDDIHSTHGMRFFNFSFKEKISVKANNINEKSEHNFSFDIWDFGGQPEYQISHKQNFDNTRLIFFVVDLQKEDNSIYFWINSIKEHIHQTNKKQLNIFIIGTKKDKSDETEKYLNKIKDLMYENLNSFGIEKEFIKVIHHNTLNLDNDKNMEENLLLVEMKSYVVNNFEYEKDKLLTSAGYLAFEEIKKLQKEHFYYEFNTLVDKLKSENISKLNIEDALDLLKKDGRIDELREDSEKFLVFKPYWKNLFSTAILRYASENKIVSSSISLNDLFSHCFDVEFDKLFEIEKEFLSDEKIYKGLFTKHSVRGKVQVLFMKSIISNFVNDKICYLNNGMLVFPSRFKNKNEEFNKKGYFQVEQVNLVSKKQVEINIATIVSCLFYSSEYEVLKYLSKGVKLRKINSNDLYLIEFSREDILSHSTNQNTTTIKVYANKETESNHELVDFIEAILEKHLTKYYQQKEFTVISNDEFKKEYIIGNISMIFEPDKEKLFLACLENKTNITIKENTHKVCAVNKRELLKIDENIEKSRNIIFDKYDNWLENKKDNKRNILHLSDLHFGENTDIKMEITLLKENIKTRIDYLILSGDLTAKGSAKEFTLIYKFISKLIKICDIDAQKVFIVPGNHDYSRVITHNAYGIESFNPNNFDKNSDYKINDKIFLKRDIKKWNCRFENFSEYLYEALYQEPFIVGKSQKLIQDNEFSFILINTSLEIDHFNLQKVKFDTKSFVNIQDEIKKDNVRFVVGHHPIDYEKSYDFVNNLHQFKIKAYIHGHVHRNNLISFNDIIVGKEKIMYIGSGLFSSDNSYSQLPGVPFRYNIITYDMDSNKLSVDTRERESITMNWRPSSLYPQEDGSFKNIYIEK
ncbi:metallophosphoesterase, partial [Poseidonibacter lekithochrous]